MLKIIVPAFNCDKYISKCLASIAEQSYSEWRCYLIDDGSTDETGKIIDQIAGTDNRFLALHKRNEGLVAALKTGLSYCGVDDVVAFVDGDDWLPSDYYDKLIAAMRDTDADAVVTDIDYLDNENRVIKSVTVGLGQGKIENVREKLCRERLIEKVFGSRVNKLFRFKIIEPIINRLDTSIGIGEDEMFTFLTLFNARSVYVCHGTSYGYVQHDGSMIGGNVLKRINDLKKVVKVISEFLAFRGYVPEKVDGLLSLTGYYINSSFKFALTDLRRNGVEKTAVESFELLESFGFFNAACKKIKEKDLKDNILWFLFRRGKYKLLASMISKL